jgi:hypothetical protein
MSTLRLSSANLISLISSCPTLLDKLHGWSVLVEDAAPASAPSNAPAAPLPQAAAPPAAAAASPIGLASSSGSGSRSSSRMRIAKRRRDEEEEEDDQLECEKKKKKQKVSDNDADSIPFGEDREFSLMLHQGVLYGYARPLMRGQNTKIPREWKPRTFTFRIANRSGLTVGKRNPRERVCISEASLDRLIRSPEPYQHLLDKDAMQRLKQAFQFTRNLISSGNEQQQERSAASPPPPTVESDLTSDGEEEEEEEKGPEQMVVPSEDEDSSSSSALPAAATQLEAPTRSESSQQQEATGERPPLARFIRSITVAAGCDVLLAEHEGEIYLTPRYVLRPQGEVQLEQSLGVNMPIVYLLVQRTHSPFGRRKHAFVKGTHFRQYALACPNVIRTRVVTVLSELAALRLAHGSSLAAAARLEPVPETALAGSHPPAAALAGDAGWYRHLLPACSQTH